MASTMLERGFSLSLRYADSFIFEDRSLRLHGVDRAGREVEHRHEESDTFLK